MTGLSSGKGGATRGCESLGGAGFGCDQQAVPERGGHERQCQWRRHRTEGSHTERQWRLGEDLEGTDEDCDEAFGDEGFLNGLCSGLLWSGLRP